MGNAYGFFEIPSVTAAVVAVDIMCKTANVEFVTWENFHIGAEIPGKLKHTHVPGGVLLAETPLTIRE